MDDLPESSETPNRSIRKINTMSLRQLEGLLGCTVDEFDDLKLNVKSRLSNAGLLGGSMSWVEKKEAVTLTLSPLKSESHILRRRDDADRVLILVRLALIMNNTLKISVARAAKIENERRTKKEQERRITAGKSPLRDHPSGPTSDPTSTTVSAATPSKPDPSNASPMDTLGSFGPRHMCTARCSSRTLTASSDGSPSETGVAHQQASAQLYDETGYNAKCHVNIFLNPHHYRSRYLGQLCHEPKMTGRVLPDDLSLDEFKRVLIKPDDRDFDKPVFIHGPDPRDAGTRLELEGDFQFQYAIACLYIKSPSVIALRVWE